LRQGTQYNFQRPINMQSIRPRATKTAPATMFATMCAGIDDATRYCVCCRCTRRDAHVAACLQSVFLRLRDREVWFRTSLSNTPGAKCTSARTPPKRTEIQYDAASPARMSLLVTESQSLKAVADRPATAVFVRRSGRSSGVKSSSVKVIT